MRSRLLVLRISALCISLVSAFAIRTRGNTQYLSGTLFTISAGYLTPVHCRRTVTMHGTCPSLTYYTVGGTIVVTSWGIAFSTGL